MSKKIEKPDESLIQLVNKAEKLMSKNIEFWIRRNTKNKTTGELSLDKLEKGWQILNIGKDGVATMHRGNEVFHIKLGELENLNRDLFSLADQL